MGDVLGWKDDGAADGVIFGAQFGGQLLLV